MNKTPYTESIWGAGITYRSLLANIASCVQHIIDMFHDVKFCLQLELTLPRGSAKVGQKKL
jgi:hypothetical protein